MELFYLFSILIIILLIYNKLSRKIEKLEQEISELKKNRISTTPVKIKIPDEILTESKKDQAPEKNILITENVYVSDETTPFAAKKPHWQTAAEDFIKQNILTIIGIFTLVLGIGYFVKYAIDKNWIGETMRSTIGYTTGLIIIATGYFLRKTHRVFSAIISGGGFAVLYFTTTIIFREYHLFSQNTAFIITSVITLFAIAISYRTKSEVLIIFALLGGFTAPLMISTGESNYIFLFTYLTVLNLGMLVTAYVRNWKSIGWLSLFFTGIYLYFWTFEKHQTVTLVFYVISYLIFYAFGLQQYFRKRAILNADIFMLAVINFAAVLGMIYIFKLENLEPVSAPAIAFCILNSAGIFYEYRKKRTGINFSVFSGMAVSLFTVAVALQFKTHLVTGIWAVQASLLLFLFSKTGEKIFRISFYGTILLVFSAQIITWSAYLDLKNLTLIFNPVFLTGIVVTATCFYNLHLIKKTSEGKSETSTAFELIKLLPFLFIYFTVLFEILYHMSHLAAEIIFVAVSLYSIYFMTVLLTFRNRFSLPKTVFSLLVFLFLNLTIIHILGNQIVSAIYFQSISISLYFVYLLYIPAFLYILKTVIPKTSLHRQLFAEIIISAAIVFSVTAEFYRVYILSVSSRATLYEFQINFKIFYLPILWAVLSCIFIYSGLKQDRITYRSAGFILMAITVFKLYTYDVWQMDHISRITAFIILGLILLVSSFTFQKLKTALMRLVEQKKDSEIDQN